LYNDPAMSGAPSGQNSAAISGVEDSTLCSTRKTMAWVDNIVTPARAAAAAGAARSGIGTRPKRSCIAQSPPGTPGTATAPGPEWNICVVGPK
jgi:hypothetical protein